MNKLSSKPDRNVTELSPLNEQLGIAPDDQLVMLLLVRVDGWIAQQSAKQGGVVTADNITTALHSLAVASDRLVARSEKAFDKGNIVVDMRGVP